LNAECQVTIRCYGQFLARKLGEILAPDNVGIPKEQHFRVSRERESLVYTFESGTLASLFSTAISILRDAALFQEVWLLSRGPNAAVGRRS